MTDDELLRLAESFGLYQSPSTRLNARDFGRYVIRIEQDRCAAICEALPLTLPDHNYTSHSERHLIAVVEAGCRSAFVDAIRDKP